MLAMHDFRSSDSMVIGTFVVPNSSVTTQRIHFTKTATPLFKLQNHTNLNFEQCTILIQSSSSSIPHGTAFIDEKGLCDVIVSNLSLQFNEKQKRQFSSLIQSQTTNHTSNHHSSLNIHQTHIHSIHITKHHKSHSASFFSTNPTNTETITDSSFSNISTSNTINTQSITIPNQMSLHQSFLFRCVFLSVCD